MRVKITNKDDLKEFVNNNNVSHSAAVKAFEKALTVWCLSDLTKEELIEEIDVLTSKYKAVERPLFIFK